MKKVVAIDTETTGTSKDNDHILQIAAIIFDLDKIYENFSDISDIIIEEKQWITIPPCDFTIDPGAEETHGMSKDFILENGIPFKKAANEFIEFTKDCDILSYNGNKFDIRFLYNDMRIVGIEFPIKDRIFYDSLAMEIKLSPRDLSSIYKKRLGKEMVNAHDAFADARATIEIFADQLKNSQYSIEEWSKDKINNILTPDNTIRDISESEDKQTIVFNFGKYKDQEFISVLKKDPNYIQWFSKNVCSPYTWEILQEYYKKHK